MNSNRFARVLYQTCKRGIFLSKKNAFGYKQRQIGLFAGVSDDNDNLIVKHNNITDEFPLVWLRDNCMCERCFHGTSQSRIINWKDFNINVKVDFVTVKDEQNIEINWHDDHKSVYDVDWLAKRSFSETKRERYLKDIYLPPRKTWKKSDFFNIMETYNYEDIMNTDVKLYQWLMSLAVYGLVLIENAPRDAKESLKLCNKIAFARRTHYGEDFHVVAREGTNNVAYLSKPLQLHTDLPYYHYKPGITLLHCIVQTKDKGGENLLADGFYVAEKLKKENREVFDILSQTDVNWSDIGEENGVPFYKIHRSPVISVDKYENICSIRHSIPQRDSYFTVNIENVTPWYKAMKLFINKLYNCAVQIKTKPGDILALDNTRVVHGRRGYDDTNTESRFLVGSHIDWDEIHSKLRVLRKKFEK